MLTVELLFITILKWLSVTCQVHTIASAATIIYIDQIALHISRQGHKVSFSLTSKFANFTRRSSDRFLKDFVSDLSSPVFLLIIAFVSL